MIDTVRVVILTELESEKETKPSTFEIKIEFLKANKKLQRYAHEQLSDFIDYNENTHGILIKRTKMYMVSLNQLQECDRMLGL